MNGKRRLLTDWKMLSALFLVVGAGLAFVYLRAEAPYRFLDGHKPIYTRIESKAGNFIESQGFSWDGDLEKVKTKAGTELANLGFIGKPTKPYATQHYRYTERSVSIFGYRMRKYDDLAGVWRPKENTDGVTVIIYRSVPDSWLTRFRLWLQR